MTSPPHDPPGHDHGPQGDATAATDGVRFGPFCLQARARRLERDGVLVPLGSRALDLLCLLVSRAGDVVRKAELMDCAWPDLTVDEGSLRFHIGQLRKVLGEGPDGQRYVVNIAGRGYCFVAPVEATPTPQVPAPPTAAQTDGLPPRPALMLGRDDVLATVAAHLATRRFVTVRGPGGIGKTTVVVALAHQLRETFANEVRFLDLSGLKDPGLVATAVASALGLLIRSEEPTPLLLEHLRHRRMLIVLDNCEHVVDAAAALAERIHLEAPDVSLLATSRESLNVEGEYVFELSPLDTPPESGGVTAEEILRYPAAHVFAERAAAAGYAHQFSDEDAAVVAEICRKVDGIPLAIELVAGRVMAYGLHQTASLLDGRLKLAWRGRRTAVQRHQTLSATLDWSYQLISDVERTILRRLGVFAGPFTLEGALAVAGDGGPPEALIESLGQLVSKSLVAVRAHGREVAYRLLDVTRAYALQKLAESGEFGSAARAHAGYVRAALEAPAKGPGASAGGWRSRDRLVADARAALAWTFSEQGDAELRAPLAAACTRLFVEINLLTEGRTWATRALSVLDEPQRGGAWELDLQRALGHALMYTEGNSERAVSALRRGLSIAEALDDGPSQFRLLSRLHALYRRTNERTLLLESAQAAESVAARIGDAAGVCRAHAFLGMAYHLIGDQARARHHLETARAGDLAMPDLAPDHFSQPRYAEVMLGRTLWIQGFPDRAVEVSHYLTGEPGTRDPILYCAGLCYAVAVHRWVGDWPAVEAVTDQLAAHTSRHGLVTFHAIALSYRAASLIADGAVDHGVELLGRSLRQQRAARLEVYAAGLSAELAEGLARQGRLAQARAAIQEAIDLVLADGESADLPEMLRVRGALHAQAGDLDAAEADLRAAVAMADRQSALSWRLRAEMSLAALPLADPARRDAAAAVRRTYGQFQQGFETADLKAARRLLDSWKERTLSPAAAG